MNQDNEFIYQKISSNYDYLMQIMDAIYSGQSISNEELLQGLGDVAKGMLLIQRDYVLVHGTKEAQEFLGNQIDAKQEDLVGVLSSGRSRG